MKHTGERMVPGSSAPDIEQEHWARYEYAAAFVKNKRVADIACGTGYGSRYLIDAGAASVVGVDLDEEAIEHARANYSHPSLSFFSGSAERLSMLDSEQFDVVVSFETIEHIPKVEDYLSEIRRILKPNGTFLVSTPDRRIVSVLYPLLRRPQNQFHIREYTQQEFVRQISRDFVVQECLGQAPISRFLACWPVQVTLKSLCRAIRRFGGDRLKEATYGNRTGVDVKAVDSKSSIPKYWVARCERR